MILNESGTTNRLLILLGGVAALALSLSGTQAAAAIEPETDQTATIDGALRHVGQEILPTESASPLAAVEGDTASIDFGASSIHLTLRDIDDSQFRVRDDGIQALSVLHYGETETEFEVSLPPGATVQPDSAGGFDIVNKSETAALSYAKIETPWAVDATGATLSTSYTLAGSTLIQTVDTSNAVFPVVADPRITLGLVGAPYGPGLYLNLTGIEMNAIFASVVAAGGAAAIVGCTVARLPTAIRNVVNLICGAVGFNTLPQIFAYIQQTVRSSSFKSTTCYQTLVGGSQSFVATARSNCS